MQFSNSKWMLLIVFLLFRFDKCIGNHGKRSQRATRAFHKPQHSRQHREFGNLDRLVFDGKVNPGTDPVAKNNENITSTQAQAKKKSLQYIILPPDYNKYKIPWRSGGTPMAIEITVEIRKVLDFDEIDEHTHIKYRVVESHWGTMSSKSFQRMTLDLDLTVGWTDFKVLDYRLNNTLEDGKPGKAIEDMTRAEINDKKRIINDPAILSSIWKPNIFFDNLISIKQPYVMATPVKLKVIPEAGYIQYITRLSVTVDCAMGFEYYPADTQTCEFLIRPFSYTSNLVRLHWHKSTSVWLNDVTLPSFNVKVDDVDQNFVIDSYEDTDKSFKVLTFNVHVRRNLSYHIVQTYMASTFYIIITCLCFLLPPRMVEARIGISMTTLLTLTSMFAAVRESTPITSYVKAIDIWMVCCIFFVFLTLAQFTFYTWLRHVRDESEETEKQDEVESFERRLISPVNASEIKEIEIKSGKKHKTKPLSANLKLKTLAKYESMAFFIERFSFVIFLSIFGVYTILYFTWLLLSSDYFNWKVDPVLNYLEGHDYNKWVEDLHSP